MVPYRLAALLLLSFITRSGLAQSAFVAPATYPLPVVPLDSVTHRILYRGVLPAPGHLRAEVYGRAQEWIARQFEQYSAVVQLADAGRGVLIGRAITQTVAPAVQNLDARRFNLGFLFRLRVQDGLLQYELTDISYPRYPLTSAASSAPTGQAIDALVEWQRTDDFSRLATLSAQDRRRPVEADLCDDREYTNRGEPKPRLVQQCLGIDAAMRTLLDSLGKELLRPLP